VLLELLPFKMLRASVTWASPGWKLVGSLGVSEWFPTNGDVEVHEVPGPPTPQSKDVSFKD